MGETGWRDGGMKNRESATTVHLACAMFRSARHLGGGALPSIVQYAPQLCVHIPDPHRDPMIMAREVVMLAWRVCSYCWRQRVNKRAAGNVNSLLSGHHIFEVGKHKYELMLIGIVRYRN